MNARKDLYRSETEGERFAEKLQRNPAPFIRELSGQAMDL